jgi:hypothetical protein
MSGSVPHLPWRRTVLVLAAAVSLAASGSALAAGPTHPGAKPLWKAYPLDTGTPTRTLDPPAPAPPPGPGTTRAPLANTERPVAPLAVAIFFYAAIVILILGAGFVAVRQLRRARAPRSPGRAAGG